MTSGNRESKFPSSSTAESRQRQTEPTETTPLNRNIPPREPEVTSQQVPALRTKMDAETKSVLVKIVIDVVLLLCGEFWKKNYLPTSLNFRNFSRHSDFDFLHLWLCLRTRLLLWRWIFDASIPRIDGDARSSLHSWLRNSHCRDNHNWVCPLAVEHGQRTRTEVFRTRNSILDSKSLQIFRNLFVRRRLQSTHNWHWEIFDRPIPSTFHQRVPTDHAWRIKLHRPEELSSLHWSLHVWQRWLIGPKTQGNAFVIPQRTFQLLDVHDVVCRALPPLPL